MKKIFTIIFAVCLIVPLTFVFAGCNEQTQITMQQIQTELKEAPYPNIEGEEAVSFKHSSDDAHDIENIYDLMLDWQRTFAINDIDTRYFMTMDQYKYYFEISDIEAYIYVFKFDTERDARECCKKFDFTEYHHGQEYKSKTYGNLVVAVKSEISQYVFNLIKNIK